MHFIISSFVLHNIEDSGKDFYGCPSSKVALRDMHRRYVVALTNDMLRVNSSAITNEAVFTLVDLGVNYENGTKLNSRSVGLKSVNGRWLVAYPSTDNITFDVWADGYNKYIGDNEKLIVKHNKKNKFWFETAQGRYLIGRPDGSLAGDADKHDLRRWAKFRLICIGSRNEEFSQTSESEGFQSEDIVKGITGAENGNVNINFVSLNSLSGNLVKLRRYLVLYRENY